MFNPEDHPHRRLNLLTGEWVLVSPHRAKRPWQGQVEKNVPDERPSYDPKCYLCPGNERAGGKVNPDYSDTFVFDNDFAALIPDAEQGEISEGGLLMAKGERGRCRVICFSPDHSLTLPEMEVSAIRKVVDLWTAQYQELGSLPEINHVQIFENKGQAMGCSNPHPHGQVWAQETLPGEPAKELATQSAYYQKHGSSLLADYLALELKKRERLVVENEHFACLVPFWAVWPFETLIISKRQMGSLLQFTDAERDAFASIIKKLTIRYDNLFNISFPYSAGMHQAPTDGKAHPEWHFHMHFYPPLLRSATVKKFMVGYEMLGDPQRDITAEGSAARLRELPEVHYKKAMG